MSEPSEHPDPDVVIIGGGVSGLTAALEFQRAGRSFVLLEKERELGGLVGTSRERDFLIERGPDAILRDKPHGIELVRELGLEPDMLPTSPSIHPVLVMHRGKLVPMPDGMRLTVPTKYLPVLSSPLFSWRGRLRMLAERWMPATNGESEESIASFMTRRFGAEALERLGEPLLAGIHCGRADRLSMNELFPRLVELEKRHGSLSKAFRAQPERTSSMFFSFRGGMGTLIRALAERLPGQSVKTGSEVASVSRNERRLEVRLNSGERYRPQAVLIAVPLSASPTLVQDLSPTLTETLRGFSFASTVIVFHGYQTHHLSRPLEGFGFIVPKSEQSRLLAATFMSSKFDGRAPEGHHLVRLFLGGYRDPEIGAMSDDALAELAHRELEKSIGPCGEPVVTRVVRWPRRTPQVELGHRERVSRLEQELDSQQGIYLIANGLRAVGIPDCIAQAKAQAARILVRLGSG